MPASHSTSHLPVEILQIAPLPQSVEQSLANSFQVHKLWLEQDEDAFLIRCGPTVRGLASAGHRPIDLALLSKFPRLEIVASFGVGYDHIDARGAAEKGIVVTHTPDVLSDEVADLTMGLLIATVRKIPQADAFVRAGGWGSGEFPLSGSLRGRKVGILGLGRIGKAVARRLSGFGLNIAYHGRRKQDDVELIYYDSLRDLAEAVDILVITAPGGEDTKGIVDRSVLALLGKHGYVVNVGRGSIINEVDLVECLVDGSIAGAGLDVFENEPHVPAVLTTLKNVVILPHIGSATLETRNAMGQLVADNLIAWFETGRAVTPTWECEWIIGRTAGQPLERPHVNEGKG